MNAAIRAIVRAAVYNELHVVGFRKGYQGVLDQNYVPLNSRSVSNIIQRGGTILGSSRCDEFRKESGRIRAKKALEELDIDALFVIGGNGSMHGAFELQKVWTGQIIGLPGTIDNDCGGTDWTIGFHTALDTALEAIDKIRDTAEAFDRIFLIEVMGRKSGDIALGVGITGGAEEVIIPEEPCDIKAVARRIIEAKNRGKGSYIIIVAEGVEGGSAKIAAELQELTSFECRTVVLGYLQRGGSPVSLDRWIATKMGVFAVQSALHGATGVMIGIVKGELVLSNFEKTWTEKKIFDPYVLEIQNILCI